MSVVFCSLLHSATCVVCAWTLFVSRLSVVFCWLLHSATCVVCEFVCIPSESAWHPPTFSRHYQTLRLLKASFTMCKCPWCSVACRIRQHVLYVRVVSLCLVCLWCFIGCCIRQLVYMCFCSFICVSRIVMNGCFQGWGVSIIVVVASGLDRLLILQRLVWEVPLIDFVKIALLLVWIAMAHTKLLEHALQHKVIISF